ncbi:hypothetical protein [Saccharomonospora sp. NB11]|nr:hypothetical protein [Saccharomonospora sp. NB11]
MSIASAKRCEPGASQRLLPRRRESELARVGAQRSELGVEQ